MVVGLGNPGETYVRTRHNVGFMVLDKVVEPDLWKWERAWNSVCALKGGVVFCKPQTFMNLSGRSVASVAGFYKVPPQRILVVLDDFSLELGRLRIRTQGSAGGHNGLASVIESMGTKNIPRLRMGIGGPGNCDVSDYVLGTFKSAEMADLEHGIVRAVQAVGVVCSEGVERGMNLFNRAFD